MTPREVSQLRILQSHMDLLATPRPSEKEEAERQRVPRARAGDRERVDRAAAARHEGEGFPKRDPHALATVVLAMIVSVWRWYRPGGPMTLDQVRKLISGACLRVVGP